MTKPRIFKTFICILAIIPLLSLASCSNSQNLKDKKSKSSNSNNSITIRFNSKTTTENGKTVDNIEKASLDKYTKALSDVFSKGSRIPALFKSEIFTQAQSIFEPPKNATKENVNVDLNILKSETATDNIGVAHIKQSKTEAGKAIERSGTIYFNNEGIVIGYKLDLFPIATTTDSKVEKS